VSGRAQDDARREGWLMGGSDIAKRTATASRTATCPSCPSAAMAQV
jgi:hypothetical protein